MTEVAFNAPQYGYGSGVPQPPLPQPVPLDKAEVDDSGEARPVRSYDMDPAYDNAAPEHAPPAVVPPTPPVAPTPPVPPAPPTASVSPAPPVSGPHSSGRVAAQVVDRLRNNAERGTTTVPNEVIEKIATLAVREVPGVYAFGEADAPYDERPLAIELAGRTATVEIHVVVEYGFAVYAVTDKVRTKVISALENLFALDVTAVDIVIDDIHIEQPEAPAEA
jgi:uncharacterized alkaline shock family protein YloU